MGSSQRSILAPQFDDLTQQYEASALGMWLFLATEVMVFGGLFAGYTAYRCLYPSAFATASRHLNIWYGGTNTLVLITSSLTMALAVYGSQVGNRRLLVGCLAITAALGVTFLVIKAFEYLDDYHHSLVPLLAFNPDEWTNPEQVKLFLTFYYIMTGLHGLHMIGGIGVVIVVTILAYRGWFSPEYHTPVELSGLYWHFVDIIWIFLLPLLYLIAPRA